MLLNPKSTLYFFTACKSNRYSHNTSHESFPLPPVQVHGESTSEFTPLPCKVEMRCAAGGNAPAWPSRIAQFCWYSGACGARQKRLEPAVGSPGFSSEAPAADTQALAPFTLLQVNCSGGPEGRSLCKQCRCFFPP